MPGVYHASVHLDIGSPASATVMIDAFVSGDEVLLNTTLGSTELRNFQAITVFDSIPAVSGGTIEFDPTGSFSDYSVLGAFTTNTEVPPGSSQFTSVTSSPSGPFGPVRLVNPSVGLNVYPSTGGGYPANGYMGINAIGQTFSAPLDFEGLVTLTPLNRGGMIVGSVAMGVGG